MPLSVGNSNQQLYTDHTAYKLPVSVKGIIYYDGRFLLRKNERSEWELIGGKLEPNEQPDFCVIREIKEETGIIVKTINLLDSWVYCLGSNINVLILTYACRIQYSLTLPIVSPENTILSWFTDEEIEFLNMPTGYKNSIKKYQSVFLTK